MIHLAGFTVGFQAASSALRQNTQSTTSPASAIVSKPSAIARSDVDEGFPELVQTLHQQVNEFRHEHGLEPLELDPIISAQARAHSVEMARSGRIDHRGFDERLNKIREKVSFRTAAENVAFDTGYKDPARAAVQGWKKSAGHRKNMLGNYSLTGIGVSRSQQGRYFFTQIFLEPSRAVPRHHS